MGPQGAAQLQLARTLWPARREAVPCLRCSGRRRIGAAALWRHRYCDTLDDSSHKHAFEVSTDLKYALRECIEIIGNEAIRYKREVAKGKVFDRNDIDLADQVSRECLRYMYRLLFLFYIEARPDLGYAPITAEAYLKGYSLEHLRELEQMPLTTAESQEGTYFHESLKQLFTLIWEGFPKRGGQSGLQDELMGGGDQVLDTGFTIAPLQGHLFDPKQTPLLGSVKLRNQVLQKVIRLMSLSREAGRERQQWQGGRAASVTARWASTSWARCTNRCCPSAASSPRRSCTRCGQTRSARRRSRPQGDGDSDEGEWQC
ncbi:MAG: hypothetical protein IPJ28_13795 [Betaproteobacteria bacterium]|nr:hypothetical protein [Betaproteobacteria bacterium]